MGNAESCFSQGFNHKSWLTEWLPVLSRFCYLAACYPLLQGFAYAWPPDALFGMLTALNYTCVVIVWPLSLSSSFWGWQLLCCYMTVVILLLHVMTMLLHNWLYYILNGPNYYAIDRYYIIVPKLIVGNSESVSRWCCSRKCVKCVFMPLVMHTLQFCSCVLLM